MKGSEVCQQIKASDSHQPAVLMFFDKPEECDSNRGSKPDAYISKLCRPQELVDAILKLLGQRAKLASQS